MIQHHLIEVFSTGDTLLLSRFTITEIGKCEGYNQVIYDVDKTTEEIKTKMRDYDVKSVRTTVIDDE